MLKKREHAPCVVLSLDLGFGRRSQFLWFRSSRWPRGLEVNTQLRLESDACFPVICRFEITKHCGLYWRGCQPYSLHPRLRQQHVPVLRHKYDIPFAVEILAVFVAAAGEISLLAYLHLHTCLFTHVS